MEYLAERTGTKVLVVGVRSEPDMYNAPFVLATDERIAQFVELRLKHTLMDFAIRMEAFLISGVHGKFNSNLPRHAVIDMIRFRTDSPLPRGAHGDEEPNCATHCAETQ